MSDCCEVKTFQPGAADDAIRRGRDAYQRGSLCNPPEDEPLLTRTWWTMGWDGARADARFKRGDLVEWDVMVITSHDGQIGEGKQQGRITAVSRRSVVIDTPQGPLQMPLDALRKVEDNAGGAQ